MAKLLFRGFSRRLNAFPIGHVELQTEDLGRRSSCCFGRLLDFFL